VSKLESRVCVGREFRVSVFQGAVEIEDGDSDAETILINIEKHGQSLQQIGDVSVEQTLFDVGRGTIFVLQLVPCLPHVFHSFNAIVSVTVIHNACLAIHLHSGPM